MLNVHPTSSTKDISRSILSVSDIKLEGNGYYVERLLHRKHYRKNIILLSVSIGLKIN